MISTYCAAGLLAGEDVFKWGAEKKCSARQC